MTAPVTPQPQSKKPKIQEVCVKDSTGTLSYQSILTEGEGSTMEVLALTHPELSVKELRIIKTLVCPTTKTKQLQVSYFMNPVGYTIWYEEEDL